MSKPVWQLPNDNDCIIPNAKYHCFIDNESLCGKYIQDTNYNDNEIESGEVACCPQIACKVCRTKWIKQYYVLS